MAGLGAGAVLPSPFSTPRKTRPASPEASALGRLAVTAPELAVLVTSLLVTTGAVLLTPPSWTRSMIVAWPEASVLLKLSVSVPVPLALPDVVIQYAHS